MNSWPKTRNLLKVLAGLVFCLTTALLAAHSEFLQTWQAVIPLGFVFIVVLLARRYGLVVGMIGAPLVALVFAYFMYAPLGSFRVDSQTARVNLAWMILGSVVLSFLIAAPPAPRNK